MISPAAFVIRSKFISLTGEYRHEVDDSIREFKVNYQNGRKEWRCEASSSGGREERGIQVNEVRFVTSLLNSPN
ncbi:hypothetical protein [Thermococcus sp.]|uniref:hypothetical protein n=1 Tax=Thermococcus sp. TaxID=35749 RepID=UPI00262C40D8|nr:hypothetical protein [Thermococcus sp.]